MPYADVCGVRLFYEDVGEGIPFLLLPGALGTGRSDFGPQLDALPRRGVRVISPDPRGYGKSRPPRRDFPIDFYQRDARDFATLMETLDCPRYALGGWSDGAITSLFLALDRPACVSRLALWGGNAYVTQDDIDAYETTRSVADWSPRAAAPMQELYGDDFQPLWTGWCDVQQALLAAGGDLCRERLSEIRCPTLLLHGENDPLVPVFHAHFLQRHIADARLHVFPGGKHSIHLAHADEFNALLGAFLAPESDRAGTQ